MRRLLTFFLAVILVIGAGIPAVGAEEAEEEKLTHLETLQKLCTGFPYVGYEKYPEVPQYFQQDYAHVSYGGPGWNLAILGCGIVCLAMISTYLTDEEHDPEELAVQFASYGSAAGTSNALFDESPQVLGFQLEKRTYDRSEVIAALENGQLVVSLQKNGIFTTTAHFIVLTGITPEGKILVYDPNRENQKGFDRFYDGYENGFEQADIFRTGSVYWVYPKKVVFVPGCTRCADPAVETVPICQLPHYCRKCTALTNTQTAYYEAVRFLRPKLSN